MIPEEAVEAAFAVLPDGAGVYVNRDDLRVILEAADQHLMAYERLRVLHELADQWAAEGDERIVADSRYYGLRLRAMLQERDI